MREVCVEIGKKTILNFYIKCKNNLPNKILILNNMSMKSYTVSATLANLCRKTPTGFTGSGWDAMAHIVLCTALVARTAWVSHQYFVYC